MDQPTTIQAEVKPVTQETIRNYYGVKELPTATEAPVWDAEDEEGWDW